ncbi:hypothetical protein SODALDRAFT_360594 [Sodiomyces alkalinus F11]|uniref:Uncharacterized protein n=1 Tax=Sodiomyces alkalinus (strain CBS 110278 / VKM F-3762 / F11) TaxID=1314773 RepID=A0A3N2PUT2_SODAK|nr:hypothetical protein SODALDRAFT_360594 [Sodiomyces alkalinus F11]ROT38251.1 hypothetical protein SODALDRAFT_360594 [Sodiomyces alkalinus F11]
MVIALSITRAKANMDGREAVNGKAGGQVHVLAVTKRWLENRRSEHWHQSYLQQLSGLRFPAKKASGFASQAWAMRAPPRLLAVQYARPFTKGSYEVGAPHGIWGPYLTPSLLPLAGVVSYSSGRPLPLSSPFSNILSSNPQIVFTNNYPIIYLPWSPPSPLKSVPLLRGKDQLDLRIVTVLTDSPAPTCSPLRRPLPIFDGDITSPWPSPNFLRRNQFELPEQSELSHAPLFLTFLGPPTHATLVSHCLLEYCQCLTLAVA